MRQKFTLEIELGNDEMIYPYQVAEALEHTADNLPVSFNTWEWLTGTIRDANGNQVGSWKVKP